jgi:hypothetical protein
LPAIIFAEQPIFKITEELNDGSNVHPQWIPQQPRFSDQSPILSSVSRGIGFLQNDYRSRLRIELATPRELYLELQKPVSGDEKSESSIPA